MPTKECHSCGVITGEGTPITDCYGCKECQNEDGSFKAPKIRTEAQPLSDEDRIALVHARSRAKRKRKSNHRINATQKQSEVEKPFTMHNAARPTFDSKQSPYNPNDTGYMSRKTKGEKRKGGRAGKNKPSSPGKVSRAHSNGRSHRSQR